MIKYITLLYLLPMIIVVIGTQKWAKHDSSAATPLLVLACIPVLNLVLSFVVGVFTMVRMVRWATAK